MTENIYGDLKILVDEMRQLNKCAYHLSHYAKGVRETLSKIDNKDYGPLISELRREQNVIKAQACNLAHEIALSKKLSQQKANMFVDLLVGIKTYERKTGCGCYEKLGFDWDSERFYLYNLQYNKGEKTYYKSFDALYENHVIGKEEMWEAQ